MPSPYEILEVPENASPEEVREAFRLLAFAWHPDRFSQGSDLRRRAALKFQRVHEAYRSVVPEGLPQGSRSGGRRSGPVGPRAARNPGPARRPARARFPGRPALRLGLALLLAAATLVGFQVGAPLTLRAAGTPPVSREESGVRVDPGPVVRPPGAVQGIKPSPGRKRIGDDGLALDRPVSLGFYRPVR